MCITLRRAQSVVLCVVAVLFCVARNAGEHINYNHPLLAFVRNGASRR